MPLPLAIPIIMAVGSLLGAGASIVGGIAGANAERDAAKKRQEAAEAQANIANMSMMDALARGAVEAGRIRSMGSRTIAAQRVAYASTGVDVGQGTVLDVLGSSRAISELDALTAKNNAARAAWGFAQDAQNLRRTGQYARQAGEARATGTLLTAGGQAAQQVGNAVGTIYSART